MDKFLKKLPHSGNMQLLDVIIAINVSYISCKTLSHCNPDNPLRSADGSLNICHAIEYAAQAAGTHQIYLQQTNNKPQMGLLLSTRNVKFLTKRLDSNPQELLINATCLSNNSTIALYGFKIMQSNTLLASGQLSIMTKEPV